MDDRQEINSVLIRIKRKLSNMEIDQIQSGSFRSHDTRIVRADRYFRSKNKTFNGRRK